MAELAIAGGEPCVKEPVEIRWPVVDERDVEHVAEVVRAARGGWSRWSIAEGEDTTFEEKWAAFQQARHCLLVANGTVAIECALKGLGLEPGDEVIVTSLTFIASASAILIARGVPVFADIIPETFQIDPDDVERKITERTRGIVVVHYGGYPTDMTRILEVARRHGLFVLEDSAHAHGSEWEGRRVGAIGDAGTFSFEGSKSLPCGEGGAIVTNREEVYEACWAYHHIGRILGSEKYDHQAIGPNLRLSELQAAVLHGQFERLLDQIRRRMATAARLRQGLREVPGIEPLQEDARVTQRGFYYFVMRFDEATWGVRRDTFVAAVKAEGCRPVSVGYGMPVYQMALFARNTFDYTGYPVAGRPAYGRAFDYKDVRCPNAERAAHHEQITWSQRNLLHPQAAENLLTVFGKLWENRAELQRYQEEQA